MTPGRSVRVFIMLKLDTVRKMIKNTKKKAQTELMAQRQEKNIYEKRGGSAARSVTDPIAVADWPNSVYTYDDSCQQATCTT